MSIILKMSLLILFAFIISSCATNRIQYTKADNSLSTIKSGKYKKKELNCTFPKSHFSSNKNKSVRLMQSNKRLSARFAFHIERKKKFNSFSFKNSSNNNMNSEELISGLGKSLNSKQMPDGTLKELLSLQNVPGSDYIKTDHSEPHYLHPSFQLLNEPKYFSNINRSLSDDKLHTMKQTYDTNFFTLTTLKQEEQENITDKKISIKSGETVSKPVENEHSQRKPVRRNENVVYLMTLLAGCFSLIGLKSAPDFSRNISRWATINPWKTRFLITGIHILTGTAGIILGKKLADSGTHFTELSKNLSIAVFLTSSLLYPVRKSQTKLFKHTYLRQKTHDLALFLSGFMLIVNIGNHYSELNPSFASLLGTRNFKQQQEHVSSNNIQVPYQLVFYKSENQSQDGSSVHQKKELGDWAKFFLTILAIAVACGLGYGLAVLSCSIACSGSQGLAVVVGIGGLVAIIALLFWALRSIFSPKHKETKVSYQT
ncbi:MAG: hypothetical protein WA816_05685 [Bacteroidales bacterium]